MHGPTRRRRWLRATALAATVTLLAAACGGGTAEAPEDGAAPSAAGGDTDRELVIWAGSQTPITANFNPFNAAGVLHLANGGIYETLFAYNKAADTEPVPLLGTDFAWSEDGTELTVTLRDGVEWNDGEPFTTDDVVYSFLNEASKPAYLADAVATDDSAVLLSFDEPQFTNEFALLGATYMVPEHVFSQHEDAEDAEAELSGIVAWPNAESPVGTGPYLVETTSDAAYTAVANPGYWGGEPAVKNLRYVGIDSNQSAEDLLATGQVDWATMFVPEPERIEAAGYGYLNTPVDPTVLYTCANADLGCEGDQTDVAVRQALSVAIDRGQIAEKAFVGLTADISPTFALLGRDDKWIADGMPAAIEQSADADQAGQILEDAGYEKDADGFYGKDGEPIELTLTSVDGWSDYNNAAKLIEEQAAAAGIKVIASTVSWNEFADSRTGGEFQLVMGGVIGTSSADPYQIYRDWFSGDYTTPVGTALEPGFWNFSRYANDEVDAAVKVAAGTDDESVKADAYATVQEHIVHDVPYIPLVVNATQTFYNSTDYTGWPTEEDLYLFPPAWQGPTSGVILGNLTGTE
ncbi:ABC transporter substrate-binding protein [Isoptericola halotolerans]|uniref:Peptide/nickel transport system substrate-binding protein n=1 Tax=Isoptericola halotolerans TaxID=300560 RepID=A0ABX2A2Q3_9MICO|nr:ABC transporter substrate-binding protein [Isoptericola halotolerans]NOV95881.1 peptide/nickel transport system substrate-binding protein [Isoptericola halotolerans]